MSDHRKEIWNLPNKLSLVRIGASPVLIALLTWPGRGLSIFATLLFLAVSLTDWLDGYLARKTGQVTVLGKFLDPLADKLLIITSLIMLISLGRAPAWIVSLIVAREIAITGLRTVAVRSGMVIQASPLGKSKTVSQMCAVTPLILHYEFWGIDFHSIGAVILWVALGLTIWSGVDYFLKFINNSEGSGQSGSTHQPDSME